MIENELRTIKKYDMWIDDNYMPQLKITTESKPMPTLMYEDMCTIVTLLCNLTHLNEKAYEESHFLFFNNKEKYNGFFDGFYKLSKGNYKEVNCSKRDFIMAVAMSGCRLFYTIHNHPAEEALYPSDEDLDYNFQYNMANLLEIEFGGEIIVNKTHWIFADNPEYKYNLKNGEKTINKDWATLPENDKKKILNIIEEDKRKAKEYERR